jgi:drug/metabolite transporter (DMT)-like permease
MRRVPADVPLLVCAAIWGLNFAVTKYAITHGFSSLAYQACRFGIATAVFTSLAGARDQSLAVDRRSLRFLVVVGAVVILANQLAFVFAIRLASASTFALLFGTMPIFAALFQRERLGGRHWLAATVSFGGVGLVAAGASGGLSGGLGGILIGVCAPATWAFYSVLLQPYVARYSSTRVNAVVSVACCVPFLVVAAPALVRESWSDVPLLVWACLLFSSVLAYAFTNLVWLLVIERVGTARASMYANLQPFLGALFAVLLLSESMRPVQVAGGIVIASGIVLARWRRPLEPSPD